MSLKKTRFWNFGPLGRLIMVSFAIPGYFQDDYEILCMYGTEMDRQ